MSTAKKPAKILEVRVDLINWSDFYEFIKTALNGNIAKQIVTINGEIILKAQNNSEHQTAINNADLVTVDSSNIQVACALKGYGWPSRLPGADIVVRISAYAAKNNYSIFLLGGRGGVAKKSAQYLQNQFPSLKIVGVSEANPDDRSIPELIKKSAASIVFVAYGAPEQEIWIAKNKELTGAKILIGIGGVFDMLSGNFPRAPKFLQLIHLEWLWRLILQPTRLNRIFQALVVFPLKVILS